MLVSHLVAQGESSSSSISGKGSAKRERLQQETEQSSADNGKWDLGFLLCLLEDPAPSMFAWRGQAANARLRAFSLLVPQTLASVTLAYVREEAKPKKQRFPRRPKPP